MRARAQRLGGSVEVVFSSSGTRVSLRVPLRGAVSLPAPSIP